MMNKIKNEKIEKILVIRLDKVGDLILSTPFLRNLRENFPGAHIGAMATPYTADVLRDNPNVDEIIIYDPHRPLLEKRDFKKSLGKSSWNIAISLSPTTASYEMAFQSRANLRFGYAYSRRWLTRAFAGKLLTHLSVIAVDEALRRNEKIPHEVEQTFFALMSAPFDMRTSSTSLQSSLLKTQPSTALNNEFSLRDAGARRRAGDGLPGDNSQWQKKLH